MPFETIRSESRESEIANHQLLFVYSLELNGWNETKLFRCDKFNQIRFQISPSLYGRRVCLKTNYTDDYAQFNRSEMKEVDISENLQFKCSGSFQFIYTDQHDEAGTVLGSFYIVVSPEILVAGARSKCLSINALQCQTVLSKLMGPIDTWKQKLEVSIQCHYNMIHWTPIQTLGASNSAYSLADQLALNPSFRTEAMKNADRDCTIDNVSECIEWLRREHGVISIIDIVLNHTANESAWLQQQPHSAYNCQNSPWLRPAFLLDRMLYNVTLDIEHGRWIDRGITSDVYQLETIRNIIYEHYLPSLRLQEFYLCNTSVVVEKFEKFLRNSMDRITLPQQNCDDNIILEQDPQYRRLCCTVDMENAFRFIANQIDYQPTQESIGTWLDEAIARFRQQLIQLNDRKRQEVTHHIDSAIDNVMKGAQYERFDPNGPKVTKLTGKNPLTTQYFTDNDGDFNGEKIVENEFKLYDDSICCFYMAHNGWVMGDDPLRNFAEKDSQVYLRRELICWGDSVKLRYGQNAQDSPFLWSHMERYVTQMATVFQGLRLDNCHSTPIHVAQHMIDVARRVNPDLYLIAELFTSNEDLDNVFVNKLGINSLIREAMSASTPFELQRQVYRFGGQPVGSFKPDLMKTGDTQAILYSRPMIPSVTHAIFFDQTHDNESPIVRRTAYDPLPTSALISMTYSATGSNRGYDELVPHHVHVVDEQRLYYGWNDDPKIGVNLLRGILHAKRVLNQLHHTLNSGGYSEAFVDQRDRDTIVITRHNPTNHRSIVLAARTAFYPIDGNYSQCLPPLKIEGKFEKILFEIQMIKSNDEDDVFKRDERFINGLCNLRSVVNLNVKETESEMVQVNDNPNDNIIEFKKFPPSSVIAFSFTLLAEQQNALNLIKRRIDQFDLIDSDISKIINQLNLIDLNYILFRCQQEEFEENSIHTYQLSNGPLVYSGLAGIMFHLAKIRTHNDLGHPLCENLRQGNWLPSYIVQRLLKRDQTVDLARWLEKAFESLEQLPRYLIPRYFDSILCPLWTMLLDKIRLLHSDFIRNGDEFVRRLTLGGVALLGFHARSPLPPLHHSSSSLNQNQLATMAAGLPHFSTGYMRNWGRDTFISLKGLTLLTGRFIEAKTIILAYAGCLRHGLIANLLDGGYNARYNCRDAVWWWLEAIKQYIQIVPDGHSILNENVYRIFPRDDSLANEHIDDCTIEPLHRTMQEALNRHFDGIDFVERNAGSQIDAHMTSEGFHMQIGVDRSTGFVYGGNQWNCGTWMDKMGSSDQAGNRGRPATPRDGSAVEIVALSQSVVEFLATSHQDGYYPYEGVHRTDSDCESWTFRFWSEKICENFEKYFYVSGDCRDQYVNRRYIYKDTYGSTIRWMDYQLRPNFLIAMAIAPIMFNKLNANKALDIVSETLVGPFGMKTLDPGYVIVLPIHLCFPFIFSLSDWTYRGDYDNSNDSNDANVAHGFNYHNGPEWLWLMGYYLMARMKFNERSDRNYAAERQILCPHFQHLCQTEWFGLPELTNSNGSYCEHSCPIQSWSHATLIEALYIMFSPQQM
ncbi:glycogen debranching enzyme-like protein [Euroglyphus maynei]|uniref:Glycogen debranching enzyme n=1 Tax=Euroglyphus maynei TaxID=6958 RepID=A0A1Y3BBC6_EURMA|nr:glycogen debranching enzyme-like protein [Euroglyphus maynei]